MRTIFCRFAIIIFLLLLPFGRPPAAYAASDGQAPVDPTDTSLHLDTSTPLVSLIGKPGQAVPVQLRIENFGSHPETLTITINKFTAADESGSPRLEALTPADLFGNWITFSPKTFTIQPNEWKTITATIAIPENAGFSYYPVFTFSRLNGAPANLQGGTSLIGGVGILLLLAIDRPDAKRQLEFLDFSTDKAVYQFLPVTFQVRLRNTGNVFVVPTGNIFIDQGNKHDIAVLPINKENGNILPNSIRRYTSSQWSDGFPVYVPQKNGNQAVTQPNGAPVMKLNWDMTKLSNFRIGRYRATAVVVYNNGTRDVPLSLSTDFWVIPWWILTGGAVILLILLAGLYSILKSLFRRRRHPRPSQPPRPSMPA
ncbi:hypothetical protein KGQ71_01070 [Patescibacteria group bacterium]|nr:hypothetical protein [Patescibacteria group bacterium]